MECDEMIDHIDAAEFALRTMRAVHNHKRKVTSFTVACFAFAEMSHERESEGWISDMAHLLQLIQWVEELREGKDPRCDLCKQNGKLKLAALTRREVVQ